MKQKKTFQLSCIAALTALLLAACNGDDKYTRGYCNLTINNQTEHQNATLARAMDPYSRVFVCITTTVHDGATFFRFTDNNGSPATEERFSSLDAKRNPIVGMNNGIIVGFGNGTTQAFYAYDRECPNCFNFDKIPLRSYPLQMKPSGLAECTTCHRFYDMNNDGNVAQGEGGKALTRYIASTTGPYGVLMVN